MFSDQDEVDYGATGVIAGFGKTPVELNEAVPSFVPEYNGESNCFCIQLFCIQDELETRYNDMKTSPLVSMKDFLVELGVNSCRYEAVLVFSLLRRKLVW